MISDSGATVSNVFGYESAPGKEPGIWATARNHSPPLCFGVISNLFPKLVLFLTENFCGA